jgi:hypothetical protein
MAFVFYGWLLFRAGSWPRVLGLTASLGDFVIPPWKVSYLWSLLLLITPLFVMELWQHCARDRLVALRLPILAKAALQGALLIAIVVFWEKEKVPFIYFQF